MGALGSIFGLGPAKQVQSQRGDAGFKAWGDDQMGGLMRNASGMSSPGGYTGGYPPSPFAGGFPGFPGFPGMGGPPGGGMGGQMGGGQQHQQQAPYGIQPPRGMMGQGGQQQQQGQQNPFAGIFNMLGGL
jgi:small nuclear ribonucleoprotein B and B'